MVRPEEAAEATKNSDDDADCYIPALQTAVEGEEALQQIQEVEEVPQQIQEVEEVSQQIQEGLKGIWVAGVPHPELEAC